MYFFHDEGIVLDCQACLLDIKHSTFLLASQFTVFTFALSGLEITKTPLQISYGC
ncbi:hypothetical protein GCM10010982_17930 [Bowmanella pacifica]|uniref:Uncharacterized protein n=1 Tax=Bowmanella pacifica TaxID=502051 RepID=A0A917YY07_9ALTE|nr:hypothetical protein GCM10010982_17930 [Bowmanella pacifica]